MGGKDKNTSKTNKTKVQVRNKTKIQVNNWYKYKDVSKYWPSRQKQYPKYSINHPYYITYCIKSMKWTNIRQQKKLKELQKYTRKLISINNKQIQLTISLFKKYKIPYEF